MPNDAITINAICTELSSFLCNAQITKVFQPEKDEVLFSLRNNKNYYYLIISANPNHPRIHLTKMKKENPLTAYPFCMLLRKHITNAIISKIQLINNDRIIKFTLEAKNEVGDTHTLFLIVELMGRYSNIILTYDNFKIIDAIFKIYLEQSHIRPILPNIIYSPPKQTKICFNDKERLLVLFKNNEINENLLINSISGLSKDTIKEIVYRNHREPQEIIQLFSNINNTSDYRPCIRVDSNKNIKDYYFTEYLSLKGDYTFFDTINECLDYFYSQKQTTLYQEIHCSQSIKLLKSLKKKLQKKVVIHQNKIIESEKAEQYKQYGELILSNIYKLKRGDSLLDCNNFYTNSNVTIPLDAKKSPSQNAQSYFKKYNKLNRAKEISVQQLKILKEQEIYLEAIEISLDCCQTKQEFKEIYDELLAFSNPQKLNSTKKFKQPKASTPHQCIIDGYQIYIGKNNVQNEIVTFDIGAANDIWLHTKNFHGAHAIIKGTNIPDKVISKAAQMVAYFSKGRDANKVEVVYTFKKNVKRAPNSMKGMVNYTNYKSLLVQPKNYLIQEV